MKTGTIAIALIVVAAAAGGGYLYLRSRSKGHGVGPLASLNVSLDTTSPVVPGNVKVIIESLDASGAHVPNIDVTPFRNGPETGNKNVAQTPINTGVNGKFGYNVPFVLVGTTAMYWTSGSITTVPATITATASSVNPYPTFLAVSPSATTIVHGGSITFDCYVHDQHNSPFQGASVQIWSAAGPITGAVGITGANGHTIITVTGWSAGSYVITAKAGTLMSINSVGITVT